MTTATARTLKPPDLFDRDREWDELWSFATESRAGSLRIAVVHGRRRQGKSYLLRRLAGATGGCYHQVLEEEPAPALERLGRSLGEWLGVPGGQLGIRDWEAAVDLISALRRPPSEVPSVLVIDELPYLLERVPELASLLQRAVDQAADRRGPAVRLILCGSAVSVMSSLLAGHRPLRGRASTILSFQPFDYRDAARFWGLDGRWAVALRLDAVIGGTPGYRDLLALGPPNSVDDLGTWLGAGVCNPTSAMFREDEYLLAEEPALTNRSLYHSVLSCVATGNNTETKIAAALGRERQALAWPLRMLVEAGLMRRDEDALRHRRPTYRITDPIVRFHQVITRGDLSRFEERRAAEAWADAQPRFATHILGPHFEDLARRWMLRHASTETTGGPLARVASTQLSNPAGRSQLEIDMVGIRVGTAGAVTVIGEAKSGPRPLGLEVLARLEGARTMLAARSSAPKPTSTDATGNPDPSAPPAYPAQAAPVKAAPVKAAPAQAYPAQAAPVKLAVFSAGGFDKALDAAAAIRADVELVDLDRLYSGD